MLHFLFSIQRSSNSSSMSGGSAVRDVGSVTPIATPQSHNSFHSCINLFQLSTNSHQTRDLICVQQWCKVEGETDPVVNILLFPIGRKRSPTPTSGLSPAAGTKRKAEAGPSAAKRKRSATPPVSQVPTLPQSCCLHRSLHALSPVLLYE